MMSSFAHLSRVSRRERAHESIASTNAGGPPPQGQGERTQATSVREVRLLAQCYQKAPDRISEQELQRYVLHRKNVAGLAPASMRLCYSGSRFFYPQVLQRDGDTLTLIRPQITHRLPAILSGEEVRRLLQ